MRESPLELDRKLVQRAFPVADQHCPAFTDVAWREIDQLDQRVVVEEGAALLGQLAQAEVDRLDGVGV